MDEHPIICFISFLLNFHSVRTKSREGGEGSCQLLREFYKVLDDFPGNFFKNLERKALIRPPFSSKAQVQCTSPYKIY